MFVMQPPAAFKIASGAAKSQSFGELLPGKNAPKDWDFAAPEAILKAAGGEITNIDNEDLVYARTDLKHSGIIIASNNRRNHKRICSQIKEIIEGYNISLDN